MQARSLLVGLLSLVLMGCGTVDTCNDDRGGIRLFGKDPVAQKLDFGVKEYEEGNYIASVNALQSVLETRLAGSDDKVDAYKYLAFIQCISGRERLCKDYFRKILAIQPNFELTPAEAGHPLWGFAFRSVKGKK